MPIRPSFTTPASYSQLDVLSDSLLILPDHSFLPTIYPGQPLSLRWSYWDLIAQLNPGVPIVGSVSTYVGPMAFGPAFYSSGPLPYLAGGVSQEVYGLGPSTPTSIPAAAYRLGTENLLVLEAGGPPGSKITCTAGYAVISEEFWRGLTWDKQNKATNQGRAGGFLWKEPYTVGALLTNISPSWPIADPSLPQEGISFNNLKCTLYESGDGGGTWQPIGPSTAVKIGPKGSEELTFPAIKKDWDWLIPWVWYADGDTVKTFTYTVEVTFTDDYNNAYTFRTPVINYQVFVSDRKQQLSSAAFATNAIALVLLALSWLITPTPGGAAKTLADTLGRAALDPRAPSKRYRKAVKLPALKKPRLGVDSRLSALADVLSQARRTALTDLALYEVESRVQGAALAGDKRSMKMQKRTYELAARSMVNSAAETSKAIDTFLAILREWPELGQLAGREQLTVWLRHGIGDGRLVAGGSLDTSGRAREHLDICVRSPQLIAAAEDGIEANLLRVRTALLQGASDVFRDRQRVEAIAIPRKAKPSSARRRIG